MSSNSQVLVRGEVSRTLKILRFLAVLGIIVGLVLLSVEFILGTAVATISALFSLIVEIRIWMLRGSRVWVVDRGDGFTLIDSMGSRDYHDTDIVSVNMVSDEKYSEGVLKAIKREFTVTVDGEPKPITMLNTIKVGQGDPLARLIERSVNDYRQRAVEAMEHGARVEGEQWSFSSDDLTYHTKSGSEVVAMSELSAIDVIDGEVNLWRYGEDLAFLKVPTKSKNAFLLQLVLPDHIVERPGDDAALQNSLGRVLFERKPSWVLRLVVWVLAVVLLLPTLALLFSGEIGAMIIGVAVLAGALFLIWVARRMKKSVFRCHERGVYRKTVFTERELFYRDVKEFSYAAIRQYYNGVYTGTSLSLSFVPFPGSGLKKISFNRSVNTADQGLETLRDQVSQVIAARMSQELAENGSVKWTDNLTFEPSGLRYRPSGFLGRKEAQLLPYNEIANFDVQQGTLHIWQLGGKKSVARESTSVGNFFPGFYLLATMFSSEDALDPDYDAVDAE